MKKPKHEFVVDLPRTEAGAYDPERPISGLIQNQIRRLRQAEHLLHPRHHTGIDASKLKTERDASRYIARVTAALHAEGGVGPAKPRRRARKHALKRKASRARARTVASRRKASRGRRSRTRSKRPRR